MNFRLDDTMVDALQRIKERDGIPVTEQVRRALAAWINERGAVGIPKAGKKAKK